MSIYEEKVNNFVHLLKTQPSLFAEVNRDELEKIISSQQEDIRAISNTITDFCQGYPQVEDALRELKPISRSSKGPGKTKANPNIPDYEHDKKSIINAIQQSSSGENKKEKPDKK